MGIPWETSHGMGWDRHKLLWDGMGMEQINMSHGQPYACPWECHSYGNPMGNVPWDEMGQA